MTKQKKGISSSATQSFICSLICIMFLPFLPIIIEGIATHTLSFKSIALACCMEVFGVGIASRYVTLFLISAICGMIETTFYTQVTSTNFSYEQYVIGTCAIVMFLHVFERIYRHLVRKEKFLEWGNI